MLLVLGAGGGGGEEDFIDFFADVGFIDESPVLLLPVFTVILLLLWSDKRHWQRVAPLVDEMEEQWPTA